MLEALPEGLERIAWVVALAAAAHVGVLVLRRLIRRLMASTRGG